MNDEQLTQRMRAASEAIGMSDDAQARHLEAISSVLSDGDVVPLASGRPTRRRQMLASIVAAAVIAPTGLAAASEGAVPGDALYGVKQVSERVLAIFDSDVIARHRIEEIETLESAGRVDPDLYEDARTALRELDENHPLWERLSAATAIIPEEDDDEFPADGDQADTLALSLDLPDGTQATMSFESGRIIDIDVPHGWMIAEMDDDEATLVSDAYLVDVDLASDGTLRFDTEIRSERRDDSPSDDRGGTDEPESDDAVAPRDDEPEAPSPDDDASEDSGDDSETGDDDDSSDDEPESGS